MVNHMGFKYWDSKELESLDAKAESSPCVQGYSSLRPISVNYQMRVSPYHFGDSYVHSFHAFLPHAENVIELQICYCKTEIRSVI